MTPTDSADILRHNNPKPSIMMGGLAMQDVNNKEKLQQEEHMDNFKTQIEH